MTEPADRLLTTEDVCAALNVARQTVYKWVGAGTLPARQLPGGDYRFRPEDVARLLRPVSQN